MELPLRCVARQLVSLELNRKPWSRCRHSLQILASEKFLASQPYNWTFYFILFYLVFFFFGSEECCSKYLLTFTSPELWSYLFSIKRVMRWDLITKTCFSILIPADCRGNASLAGYWTENLNKNFHRDKKHEWRTASKILCEWQSLVMLHLWLPNEVNWDTRGRHETIVDLG